MFATTITDIPGSSSVFISSYVTYTPESKINDLGINGEVIQEKGVVSPEVAMDMAIAAINKSGSDIAVSITGYAGPDADEGHSPGEAYIGYVYGDRQGCIAVNTSRSLRDWNRRYFVLMMQKTVYLLLTDKMQ